MSGRAAGVKIFRRESFNWINGIRDFRRILWSRICRSRTVPNYLNATPPISKPRLPLDLQFGRSAMGFILLFFNKLSPSSEGCAVRRSGVMEPLTKGLTAPTPGPICRRHAGRTGGPASRVCSLTLFVLEGMRGRRFLLCVVCVVWFGPFKSVHLCRKTWCA